MRPPYLLSLFFLLASLTTTAQNVGIGTNTPSTSAALDITAANKGILIPRVPAAQRLLITPVDGLMVYDTDSSSLFIYEQTAWKRIRSVSNLSSLITGVSPDDVLVWNGTNWVVSSKCSLFTYYFRDADGDGKGDKYRPVYGCTPLPGFVADSTDCNDAAATTYNGAPELCNGVDDDCDGIVDEGCVYVTLSGTGNGFINGTPGFISCPGICSQSFAVGSTVNLAATPGIFSDFNGWSGGSCTGTGGCTITVPNAAVTIDARFDLKNYLLTTTVSGNGTITSTPAGINCGADCSEPYPYGTMLVLTATPAAGHTFAGWSGGGCSGTGICNVNMTSAQNVTATFVPQQFTLSVAKSGTGSGTVTSSPAGINCGADCSEPYNSGTTVILTASPNAGSSFTGWSGGGCTGTGTCVVSVTAAQTVTASFALNTYTLSVSKAGTGNGTVTSTPAGISCGATCSSVFSHGTVVTLTASPNAGNSFVGWSGGGCSGTGTCVVSMTSAASVTATFSFPEPGPSPVALYRNPFYKETFLELERKGPEFITTTDTNAPPLLP